MEKYIPTFSMLVGIPGCGKSTYTKDKDAVVVSSDAIRKELGFNQGQGTGEVFEIMQKRSKEALLKGKDVIFDATNLTRKRRMGILNGLNGVPCVKECVLFTEPYEECLRRNAARSGFDLVPEDIMYFMLTQFQTPMLCEGFDSIKQIQTTKGKSVEKYMEESKNFDQENSHHDLSLFEHVITAEKYIYENFDGEESEKIYLQLAALYHDVGKLVTKRFKDSKGNPSEEAHYYGHENAGAYMFLSADTGLLFEDALYVSALINWHMRPYVEMRQDKREFERNLVGEEFWEKIEILHEADEFAQKDNVERNETESALEKEPYAKE